jgi:trehalose 6-phosphate synthase/phosphatase
LAVRPGLIAFDADIIARPDGRATSLATLADLAAHHGHHLLLITAMPRDKAEGLAVGGAWIAAERGAFLRDPAGTWRVLPAGDPLGSTEAEVRRHLEQRVRLVPRSYLVANEASLHWHTGRRPLPLVDALLRESVHVLDTLLSRSPWHALRTHDGLVVRSAHLHSGNAMAAVAAAVGLAAGATLTVGDRYSDEELFRWGGATGCSIAMGTPLSVARYLVANQEELEAVLAALLGGEHV